MAGVALLGACSLGVGASQPIDRQALVTRHNPVLRQLDPEAPLSVGNGRLAFTADITGLQTFTEPYDQTIPLATLSDWAWHSAPNPNGWSIDRFEPTEFMSYGRAVGYVDTPGDRRTPEIQWLRGNPHRLHLGRIGFELTLAGGRAAQPSDVTDVEQTLELWTGTLHSRFRVEGEPVEVETLCHPDREVLAVRAVSPLIAKGRLAVRIRFPYGTGATSAADWTRPEAHATELVATGSSAARFVRRLDADVYVAEAAWAPSAALRQLAAHDYLWAPAKDAQAFELVVEFARTPGFPLPTLDATRTAVRRYWESFWTSGGAVDLSGSRDPRWRELERRVVLSQYLTAIQCAGRTPPQESGLTFNSWEGKFHLEMYWWHAAHFALWGRAALLDRSLDYYNRILTRAQRTATRQGYFGARWPKMTDPSGAESPSSVGPFLVWQQPHPIYLALLMYRARPERSTLERFRDVVSETAEFMASFAASQRYGLGPPLQCAQEVFPKDRTTDCGFELAYWRWGLEAAQQWRAKLGLPRESRWDGVLDRLARPAIADGKYLFAGSVGDGYTDPRWARDHPMILGALGMLPGTAIDPAVMRRTLDWIWEHWSWADTWGWDYPLVAMCAARLGEPERAVDALLLDTPKNHYRANGHNHQRRGLTVYLPGNGGLLAAVAMMAGGWDGAPNRPAPGFPSDGRWVVRYEGLVPMP
jgi:hypothetical protein